MQTECGSMISAMNEAKSVEQLMMLEARARQKYYGSFNNIIRNCDFTFVQRTRRPPKDRLNALLSFGNVVLYNLVLEFICQSQLDPRIGVVHSTTKRSASLNLDFADIFKPIIVDRVIFTLVNTRRLSREDFESRDGGVMLTAHGKRIFVRALEEKPDQKVKREEKSISYRSLIRAEIKDFEKSLLSGKKFVPYKYY